MPGPLLFLTYALAVARVTHLVTDDVILDGPRQRIGDLLLIHGQRKLYYLTTCRWCASVWISAIAAPLAYYEGQKPWMIIPALALAFSMITGLLSTVEGD